MANTTKTRTTGLVWPVVLGLGGLALLTVVAALLWSGARPVVDVPGIPSAGALTDWLTPLARVMFQLLATCCIGLLVASAALIPSSRDVLSVAAARAARLASWCALAWAVAALFVLVLTLSETLALSLSETLNVDVLTTYVTEVPQGASWLTSAALAVFTALAAREADRPIGAWTALGLAVLTLLPPAITGHSAASGDHDLATSSLVVHIVGVALWVGGLAALWWYARTDGRYLSMAASRFSSMAVWAFVAVGVSGVINAALRVPEVSDLWSTGYGRLIVVKVLAFVCLGFAGWWHRRTSLAQLVGGDSRGFTRLALGEVTLMVATIGVAVALSQTAPPPSGRLTSPSTAEVLLGFPMPDAPTVGAILLSWRVDLLVLSLLTFAAVIYGRWVLRLRRRGDKWPVGRAIAWYAGLSLLAFASLSGLASYGRIVFSLHMTQHMVLSMMVPILLVLAAPITLALRAMPAAGRNQPSGPREWLLAALNSGFVRVLTHPVTAFVLFITAPYVVYFSGLFEVAMRQHWAHEVMHVHFILVGYLFFESLIGTDPVPYRANYPMRIVTLFASLALHAFFAVALMSSEAIIAPEYYAALDRPWWPDLLTDQTNGSAFAWAFGEVPALTALIVLLVQWSGHDDRLARRRDRQSDRDGDAELASYNAMLQERSKGRG